MVNPKISAYLGFAIKSGNLTMGFNAVETLKKGVHLMVLCDTASENSKKQALKLANKFHCPILLCKGEPLESIIGKPSCKFAAVRDKKFADALLSVQDENFGIYSGGNS
ncbi:MAG: hypothetical protein ACI4U2_02685 [Christensenellaceae bacterium]